MDDIFERATDNLYAMQRSDPLKVIVVWEHFHLNTTQLLGAYAQLCMRKNSFALHETVAMGIANFTRLAAARDMYSRNLLEMFMSGGDPTKETDLEELAEECVRKVFTQTASEYRRKGVVWNRLRGAGTAAGTHE